MSETPARARLRSFHELMRRRVQRILLVSSLYDSFVISEEGQLPEELHGHFIALERSHVPDLVQVPEIGDAVALLREDPTFDLVVSSVFTGDGNAAELVRALREASIDTPVVALAYSSRKLAEFTRDHDTSELERVFLWQGDVRIFLAIVLYVEDRLNVEHDTGAMGVPAIIVVEDSIRFYSSFLLTIYSELLKHTGQLLSEGRNLSQKMLRMRARPKVLLCTTYEEAWDTLERYGKHVLGVLSDFEYPREGVLDPHAGLRLCERVLEVRPDMRLVLQSSNPDNAVLADRVGASFLQKGSQVLLQELRQILVRRFGFGDFLFRVPGGGDLARAADLVELEKLLETVPIESVQHHAEQNHFANWMKARTEFALAETIEALGEREGVEGEALRAQLIGAIHSFRRKHEQSIIADFDRDRFQPRTSITRLGPGSLGGKARGIAFANRVLQSAELELQFPEIDVYVPPCVVLATGIFDEFLEYEWTRELALSERPDAEIVQHFLNAPFPRQASADLRAYLQRVRHPLAVRSSSLMEDSLSQPFAGVYETYMLPNNDRELDVRLRQLTDAVKRVYASTFTEQAKTYVSMTSQRLEEERMAVMIQELVGQEHGDVFYPDFSGVARSYNYYPEPGQAAEDGVAAVALGMGMTVVGGDRCLRFCPRHPRHIVGFSSVADALENSQREFHALDLSPEVLGQGLPGIRRFPLADAEEDGPLPWLGSTYLPDDNRIVDGISRPGVRLVTFAQVLKHEWFRLAELLRVVLERCASGTGAPVEIEFAGNLGRAGRRPSFAFLQLRPMALSKEGERVELGDVDDAAVICRSDRVLGNGRIDDVHDLVVVAPSSFDRARTREVAQQVARLDAVLRERGAPYVLIGVGRWGSADPFLGVPVSWNQIAGARVIVEAGLEDLSVAPSQGTHFFQNLTSSHVGYFTVDGKSDGARVDWDWLAGRPAAYETELVRHVHLERPLRIEMDGRVGAGIIARPE